jgi:hypothetical protein
MKASTFAVVLSAAITLSSSMSAAAFIPTNGHWWNPNESGRGYNIDVYNGVLVITVYTYKTNGDSEWYLASGPMSQDQRHFTGPLDKYRSGQCISCAYAGRPALIGNDGTISITFLSETSATLSLPGGRATSIQPFFPAASAASLNGTYRLKRGTVDYLGGQLLDTAAGNLNAIGTMVISGNQIMQILTITVNGTSLSIGLTGTFVDYGAFIIFTTSDGRTTRAPVVTRNGSILATEFISPAINANPPFAEVDQWERISQGAGLERGKVDESVNPFDSFGGAIGSRLTREGGN